MRLYAVTATVAVKTPEKASYVRQVPTFYLDADVQGFMDEAGAERVARDIILSSRLNGPVNRTDEDRSADRSSCKVYVTAVAL